MSRGVKRPSARKDKPGDAAQQARLRLALQAAFGSPDADAVEPLPGGASTAFPFCVHRGGCRYVVRLEGERSPLRNPHQYVSMEIAAAAGLAPRLHYADEALGVAVMDFIETRPLSTYPGGSVALAGAVGALIAQLQAGPAFPSFVGYSDMVRRLWTYLCGTGLFAPGVLDRVTERLQRVSEAFDADRAPGVASHNDLLPRNLLFDGTRLWLIDWESAYLNNPAVDIAIALDNFAPDTACAKALLAASGGQGPRRTGAARLAPARALARLYYAGVLLCASFAAQGPLGDHELAAPSAGEFEQGLRNGRFQPDRPETKHLLGKIFVASFMTGAAPPALGRSH